MFVLSRFSAATGWPEAIAGMMLIGLGIGLAVPVINLAVQNAFDRRYLGVATASSQFFRQIGGTLGVAVFGTLVVSGIHANLDANLTAEVRDAASPALMERLSDPAVLLTPAGRGGIEESFLALGSNGAKLLRAALEAVETSLADALAEVFFVGFVVSIGALGLSLLMPERPVHAESGARAKAQEGATGGGA
jgi:hypothetical protein